MPHIPESLVLRFRNAVPKDISLPWKQNTVVVCEKSTSLTVQHERETQGSPMFSTMNEFRAWFSALPFNQLERLRLENSHFWHSRDDIKKIPPEYNIPIEQYRSRYEGCLCFTLKDGIWNEGEGMEKRGVRLMNNALAVVESHNSSPYFVEYDTYDESGKWPPDIAMFSIGVRQADQRKAMRSLLMEFQDHAKRVRCAYECRQYVPTADAWLPYEDGGKNE